MPADLGKIDWPIVFILVFFAAASLTVLAGLNLKFFYFQILWFIVGFALIFLISRFDWRPFADRRRFHLTVYAAGVFLLLLTLFLAPPIRGARSWLIFGPFQLQTSELMKFILIVVLAGFFARRHVEIGRLKTIFVSFLYFLVPAVLIMLQPDLGTTLILFGIWFSFLLVSGLKWRHLLGAAVVIAAVGAFFWAAVLEDYQKERITGLFFPESDPLGVNYNVIQSKIAVGSAGFFGKGAGQGTQAQLGFLPEPHNDFIFAAFVEEWGILGGLVLSFAFLVLILRIVKIGLRSRSNFFAFFCLGSAIMFLLQFGLNVGSNLGLVPVVGVSFPFLSYGGSNLLASAAIVGIIEQTAVRLA